MRNYRDLEVWKHSHKLTLELYEASRKFPKEEMFGLTSQLRRAAISVGANLAEGCGRRTTAEFARFIRIAMGSASELDYHLLLCRDFKFLAIEVYERNWKELTRVRKMLSSLLASVETQMQAKALSANG
ncbi:MAG TPA: four helix bundle protein [Candidatus Angelobacter sp.]|nr:four helix bundle protein [Candidatus Angelobacter sp.]